MSATVTSSATGAATTTGNPDGHGQESNPLLFFVALGFGVVFTNLWIIVGVKYCFRYNRRNRLLRNGETGEPIDLITMPRTHQRRRREKKLMTMDEVNDRFPLMKYKAWQSSRDCDGLPITDEVSSHNSRSQSIGEVDDSASTAPVKEQRLSSSISRPKILAQHTEAGECTLDEKVKGNVTSSAHALTDISFPPDIPEPKQLHNQTVTERSNYENDADDDEDDEDPIRTATPVELLLNPGDTCAICLDTIEEDDDVRGLTCGHAFHASCIDPWLTSRRACCPLCKADYYIPKPRPETEELAQPEDQPSRSTFRGFGPNFPQPAFLRSRTNFLRTLPGRLLVPTDDPNPQRRGGQSGPRVQADPQIQIDPQSQIDPRVHADSHGQGSPQRQREPTLSASELPGLEGSPGRRNWASRLGLVRLSRPALRQLHLPGRHRSQREDPTPTIEPSSYVSENRTLRQLEAGASA